MAITSLQKTVILVVLIAIILILGGLLFWKFSSNHNELKYLNELQDIDKRISNIAATNKENNVLIDSINVQINNSTTKVERETKIRESIIYKWQKDSASLKNMPEDSIITYWRNLNIK